MIISEQQIEHAFYNLPIGLQIYNAVKSLSNFEIKGLVSTGERDIAQAVDQIANQHGWTDLAGTAEKYRGHTIPPSRQIHVQHASAFFRNMRMLLPFQGKYFMQRLANKITQKTGVQPASIDDFLIKYKDNKNIYVVDDTLTARHLE